MPTFDWHQPVPLTFGPGSPRRVADELGDRRAVLLTLEGHVGQALARPFADALGTRLVAILQARVGLASLEQARALSAALWPLLRVHPDTVLLGLGGGTVMDLAKLLRCRPLDGRFDDLRAALRGETAWPAQQRHALWLLPTTAGTGSELTRWATIWDTDAPVWVKRSLDAAFGWADRAFVDPELSLGCPPEVMRDSAVDAFSHALEALWNRHANPLSDALAMRAAQRLCHALPRAWRAPDDRAARHELVLGAVEAGLAFSQTRTALAHALSYAVTLEQGLAHGPAVALWLPSVWRLAIGRDASLDRQLAAVFGSATAADGALRLDQWLQDLDLASDPARAGIHDAADRLVAALHSERGRNFIAAPARAVAPASTPA